MPKITDLNEYTTPTFSDVLAIVDLDNDETKKVTTSDLLYLIEDRPLTVPSISVGGTVDNFTVDQYGNIRLNGDASSWTDILVPLTTTRIGSNAKPDFIETELAYGFPQNDITEKVFFVVQMPHSWKAGTTIYPHVHWKQTQNLTPIFQIQYKWFNIGETVPPTWTTYTMGNLARPYLGGNFHQINDNPIGIDGTGKNISSMILIQLFRNDNVYIGDALTYQFDIHYQVDSFGSDLEYIKNG